MLGRMRWRWLLTLLSNGQIEMSIGRHAGFEFVIRIVDVDFDSVYKRHALLVSLNALGRELRVGRDKGDSSVVLLTGISVGGYCRVLAPMNTSEIGLGNVCAKPDAIEIGDGDYWSSRGYDFTEFALAHCNYACGRGMENRVVEIDAREAEVGAGFIQIGLGDGDVLLAA